MDRMKPVVHDDQLERRPGFRREDLAVARAEYKIARRLWASAVERHGRTWANRLTVRFAVGCPALTHPTATDTELRALMQRLPVTTIEEPSS